MATSVAARPAAAQTLCLLCGLLCDEAVWEAQALALGQKYEVKVLSFQDFDSIGAMAAQVLAVAPQRFSLAGHSMGGRVALEVYRRAPARIERLALLDTGYEPAAAGGAERRGVLLRQALREGIDAIAEAWARPMIAPCNQGDQALLDRILRMVGRMSGTIYRRQTEALLARPDAGPVLAAIRCPTLVLCGQQDAWSPPPRHRAMAQAITGSELCLIDDCGHMCTMERPADVLAALEDWMLKS